jgi:assimilatory nitrate reductase catalytic subunit
MSSAAAASNRAFGLDRGLPFPLADLAGSDAVLLVGSNVAETMPPAVRHLPSSGVVVVDPRRTPTAELASLHLQPTPGTDLALVLGLTHVVLHEGLADTAYLAERTDDPDALYRSTAPWGPERAERVTGVPAVRIREAARLLAAASRCHVLTGRGAEQHSIHQSWCHPARQRPDGLRRPAGTGW